MPLARADAHPSTTAPRRRLRPEVGTGGDRGARAASRARGRLFGALAFAVGLFFGNAFAGTAAAETGEVRVARQFGVSYLPFLVMQEQRLLQRYAVEAGLPEPELTLVQLSGGAAANEALLSGTADLAAAGVAPFLTLWEKTKGGLDVRALAGLNATPMYLNTNKPGIRTLADFTEEDRIALPAVKVSIQAQVLHMAAEQAFGTGEEDRLDDITVSMPHPDATTALLAGGGEITAHFGSSPFQEQQLRDAKIHTVLTSYDVLDGPHTANLIYGTAAFVEDNSKTAAAFVSALRAADDFIKSDPKAAAELYVRAENSSLEPAFVESLLSKPESRFEIVPLGVMKFVDFQHRTGLIDEPPASWKELFFPPIHGLAGS